MIINMLEKQRNYSGPQQAVCFYQRWKCQFGAVLKCCWVDDILY